MKFAVVSLLPELVKLNFSEGLVGQAFGKGLLQLELINPREFVSDVHKTVDDRPYGGGDGMIGLAEPFGAAVNKAKELLPNAKLVLLSPQGKRWDDSFAREFAKDGELILVACRYGGIDQRFINSFVDEEISIGDYVLSGGELAASVLIDSIARMVPGVLGHQDSSSADSFSGGLLEQPQFTRPQVFQGQQVPQILTSGHHKKIADWQQQVALLTTFKKRPDLFFRLPNQKKLLSELRGFWEGLSLEDKQALGLETLDWGLKP